MIEPNDPRLAAYIARALATLARRDPVTPAERAKHDELVATANKARETFAAIHESDIFTLGNSIAVFASAKRIVGPEPRL